jgi:nucleotide-binding universal stress UspA family protein
MKDWEIKTIVLGYDGSEGSKRAAELAGSLARRNSAEVVVVTAFPHESRTIEVLKGIPYVGPAEPDLPEASGAASKVAEAVIQEFREAGIAAEADALQGPPADALLRAAESHEADLIVIGRRGHGAAAERLLGSTSDSVTRRATVPVLVAH